MNMKRKIFWIFPLASLIISIGNLITWRIFEFLLWLFATLLISLIFIPLATKAEERDVPVYQVFGPIPMVPVFFTFFAYMDFSRIEFLTKPQVWIYSIVTGIAVLAGIWLISGKNAPRF